MSISELNAVMPTGRSRALPAGLAGAVALGAGLAASGDAHAALLITDINQTAIDGSSVDLDVNGDLLTDFEVVVSTLKGLKGAPFGLLKARPGWELSVDGFQFLTLFGPGASIAASSFAVGGGTFGYAYENGSDGAWGAVGAQGYAGFRLDNGGGSFNYGWIELTRGSLTVGQVGFETVANMAALTPVPEPSTLALIVPGVLVVLAAGKRRRRQSEASVAKSHGESVH
jgi:hypothetical protein